MERQAKLKNKLFTNAFALRPAGDSQGVGIYTRDAKAFTGVEALVSLEKSIHCLAESGNREALRRALKEYALTVIRLERGVL